MKLRQNGGPRYALRLLIGSAAFLLAGCASHSDPAPGVREISCADSHEVNTRVGRLTNNVWNKQAIGDAPYRQCIHTRGAAPAEEWGWSWSWPATSRTILAFPQTIFGWKPWNGGESTTNRLPIAIDAIRSLRLTYEVQTKAEGRYILSTALWITRTGATASAPNPADISADINIWMHNSGFDPSGTHVDDVTIDGKKFELWSAADMGDASGANANRWNHLTYRAAGQHMSASLDIKKFIDDAVSRNLVVPKHFVSSIELGNEVMSGSGETWIKELTLDVAPL
jgi:hypothetical protein